MPLAHIHVALPLTPEKKKEIAAAASSILSQVICKPESYCMATINEVDGCMGGTFGMNYRYSCVIGSKTHSLSSS